MEGGGEGGKGGLIIDMTRNIEGAFVFIDLFGVVLIYYMGILIYRLTTVHGLPSG